MPGADDAPPLPVALIDKKVGVSRRLPTRRTDHDRYRNFVSRPLAMKAPTSGPLLQAIYLLSTKLRASKRAREAKTIRAFYRDYFIDLQEDVKQKGWRVAAITHSTSERVLSPPAVMSPDDLTAERHARAAVDQQIAIAPSA